MAENKSRFQRALDFLNAPTQRQQPTVVNNASSTQATSESSTDSGIGSTLPTSGTWAIYSLAI